MAALQCNNFVGNAWKKDLCLNCYRSKEEHHHARHDCFTSLIQTRIPDPPKEGILKRVKTKKAKNKVIFTNAECEVIGFGGDDSYSDDDYPELSFGPTDEVDDVVEESEEEKAFHKLTKTNTDYNSIAENLQEPKEGEVKKIIEPLKLGKQVFDDKGNKKTLLVSVTPFGNQQTTTIKNRINANGFLSKMNGHWTPTENAPLTTKSAKKPLEPSNNDCVKNGNLIAEKTVEISQLNGESKNNKDDEDISGGKISNDKSQIRRSQPLDKNFKFRLIKELHKETEKTLEAVDKDDRENTENSRLKAADKMNNLLDKAKEKVNQFPVITDNSNFKFKAKVFAQTKKPENNSNNSSSSNSNNNNKAVVLDMYDIGREAIGVKTTNRVNIEKSIKEGGVISSEIRAKFLAVDPKENSNFSEDLQNGDSPDKKVQKVPPVIERTKLIPNVSSLYRHRSQCISPPKEDVDDVTNGSTVKHLMNGVVSSSAVVSSVECVLNKNVKSIGDRTESNGCEEETINQKKSDEENSEDSPRKEIQFRRISIENLDKIIKGEEIILFSADGVVDVTETEKNGEPKVTEDGRSGLPAPPVPPVPPTKPPPPLFESRSSFLNYMTAQTPATAEDEGQRSGSEKPKVPAKPILIQSKRTNFQSPSHANRPRSPSMEKFLDAATSCTPPAARCHTPLQESLSSDSGKNQKRPAPKPPSPKEEPSQRTIAVMNGDEGQKDENKAKPETETKAEEDSTPKRISRSTENLLEFIASQDEKSQLSTEGLEELVEPATRRTLSLSQDNLMPCEVSDGHSKKKLSRGKFFLQKLLHLGKAKEGSKDLSHQNYRQQGVAPIAATKPKPEIIHPSDLNGSRVEVLPLARTFKSRRTSSSASSSSGELRESDILSDSSASQSLSSSGNDSSCTNDRTKKPPPPPRAHSIDAWNTKPARPPPPKSVEVLRQNSSSWCNGSDSKSDNYYVNLGEARSGLMPNKPIRTGSLREAATEDVKRMVVASTQPEDSDYESFIVSSASPQIEDNLYECLQPSNHRSSLPECDSLASENSKSIYAKGRRSGVGRDVMQHRRSEGNVDLNADCLKMKFLRSVSLPYCASETESEIYSPYSFYGSEMGEEDCEMATSNQILRMSRLKLKRGRSIVHKNLEDNYGAVVVANHEALAQVVELMHQGPAIPPPLRALTTAVNLRWTDFAIAKDEAGVVVERRVFYPALWGSHNVTLGLMAEQTLNSSLHAKGPFSLNPIAELNDLVPACYLPMLKKDGSELIQASISVMARLQIETVESYGRTMRTGMYTDESKKEVNFVLLQIINAFKNLQAQGIEEVSRNLTNLAVCREEKDPHPRICITDSFERSDNRESLCRCLIHAIKDILPPTDLTSLLSSVLLREKAVSLSQAKGILEFVLWGPADIAFGNSNRERESALQRWLDLERATVLHGLVRTRAELTVFEEWQLLFLVRTSAKMMAEASLLLENGIADEVTTH